MGALNSKPTAVAKSTAVCVCVGIIQKEEQKQRR